MQLLARSAPARFPGLPVYLLHGALDRMFPVAFARLAASELARAGAQVVYREAPDLPHAYSRDENAAILDWFLGPAAA
jgi:phospholipase/carboxylesterase